MNIHACAMTVDFKHDELFG